MPHFSYIYIYTSIYIYTYIYIYVYKALCWHTSPYQALLPNTCFCCLWILELSICWIATQPASCIHDAMCDLAALFAHRLKWILKYVRR